MKKISTLLITAVCLFQINGLCQKEKPKVAITGGVTSSNIYGHIDGKDTRGQVKPGYTVGLMVDAPLGKTRFSFQPGVHYVQKGKYIQKSTQLKQSVALRYAEFMFDFVYYTKGKNKFTTFYAGLGPTLGMNLPSKFVSKTPSTTTESTVTFGNTIASDYRGVDYGANGLLGVKIRNGIFLWVNYTFGLRNLIPKAKQSGDDILRNGCLGVRLGYMFK